jgi:integrase
MSRCKRWSFRRDWGCAMSTPELEQVAEGVLIRPMLTLDDAIDFACSSLADKTRADYTRLLHRFAADFPRNWDVAKVSEDDFVRYLSGRRHVARSTRAWEEKVLYSTFQKLYRARKIKRNPMEFVPRTTAPDPDSLDLKRVSSGEVLRMMAAAETTAERLCIAILAYLGPRRHALSLLRVRDYDPARKWLRFHEKGGKTIWKPVPDELAEMLDARLKSSATAEAVGRSDRDGSLSQKTAREPVRITTKPGPGPTLPDDYLIPPEGPLARKGDRDDRVIWRLVKKVAARAGVDAHTHSLRAAFADFYLDSGGDGKALQLLMGHKNPATTERYIQRFDRERRMEQVRKLSWASVGNPLFAGDRLGEPGLVGAGGFEPPQGEPRGGKRPGSLPRDDDLVEALKQAIPKAMSPAEGKAV